MGKTATARKLARRTTTTTTILLLLAALGFQTSSSKTFISLLFVNGFQPRYHYTSGGRGVGGGISLLLPTSIHHHHRVVTVVRSNHHSPFLPLNQPSLAGTAAATFIFQHHHRTAVSLSLATRKSADNEEEAEDEDLETNKISDDSSSSDDDGTNISSGNSEDFNNKMRRQQIRQRVAKLAKRLVVSLNNPLVSPVYAMPQAVAAVLKDATLGAVDMAVDEVFSQKNKRNKTGRDQKTKKTKSKKRANSNDDQDDDDDDDDDDDMLDVTAVVDQAFLPLEKALQNVQDSLLQAQQSLVLTKAQVSDAMNAVQAASIAQAEGAVAAVALAEETAGRKAIAEIYTTTTSDDDDDSSNAVISMDKIQLLSFQDVDYGTSEMAPPFLDELSCLVPGEPVVRVEKAPENSRRIFAGIDILASVDTVWNVLTDYAHLQNVIPNLVVNEVEELYPGISANSAVIQVVNNINDASQQQLPEEEQCRALSRQMKGSRLRQVGGAKVAGIQFSARTTLEVREWPHGMPDFAHFNDEIWLGQSRKERAQDYAKMKLTRYRFPRPFCVSKLPTRDISMQSVENDSGEFRMYQGVWRMQPLPGCVPPGQDAMRLTYAVEVSPRAYLPVQLIEARIVRDLCTNLLAIRDFVSSPSSSSSSSSSEKVTTV